MTLQGVWERLTGVGGGPWAGQRRWIDSMWLGVSAAVSALFVVLLGSTSTATLPPIAGVRITPWLRGVLLLDGLLATVLALWLVWRWPQRTATAMEQRQGRIVASICVLLLACLGPAVVFAPLSYHLPVVFLLGNATVIVIIGLAWWLVRRGLVQGGAAVLAGQLLAHILSSVGLAEPTYVLVLAILVSGLLVRWWTCLALPAIVPLLLTALQASGLAPGTPDWGVAWTQVASMGTLAVLVAWYARSLETALLVAEQRATELTAAQSQLQRAYAEVEQRVIERTTALATSEQHLRTALAQLEHASQTDELTTLYNRRAWRAISTRAITHAAQDNAAVCVLIVDVDHFKRVNDTYGHAVGDRVLQCVADRLRAATRTGDVVARYGGEEFVVLLPNTTLDAAVQVAERVRQAFANRPLVADRITVPVTVSVGVAERTPAHTTLDAILAQADLALYRAKNTGRNQIVVAVEHAPVSA